MHYAQAGKIQGHAIGIQGQEAAVGGVAQGVRQSPQLISGAVAKEGNLEFPRKAFLPGGFMCPSPIGLYHVSSPPTLTGALYVTKSSLGGSCVLPSPMSVLFGFHNPNIVCYISSWVRMDGIFMSEL